MHDKQISLQNTDDAENRLDFVEYWRSITKRKWSILFFSLVLAMLSTLLVRTMKPVYRATATMMIEANKSKVVSIEDVYSEISSNREYFQTQMEITKSSEVAMKTINTLRLWENPEFDPRIRKEGKLQAWLVSVGLMEAAPPQEWNERSLADAVYDKFIKQVSVEPVRLSQLAKISFESNSPALAAQVANTLAATYIESDLDARYKMTSQARTWLQERLTSIKAKLDESERALQNYRDKAGIVDVKGAAQSGAGKQIEDVTMRLVETRLRRAEAENAYNQIKNATKGEDMSSLPAVLRSTTVADAKKQEAEAERRLSEVSQRYGYEHPRYLAAEAEAKAAKENVRRQVETVVASVTREYEVAQGTEHALENTLSTAKDAIQGLNRKEFQLSQLERDADSNRQMYDMFLKRAKETNISSNLQSAIARVVDAAVQPRAPVKPKQSLIISAALVLGLLLGVMVSLLLDLLDNTVKTTEDLENKLKEPVLTTLPRLRRAEIARTSSGRLLLDNPKSLYSEAIRTARTGVLLSAIDMPKHILLVTSSVPEEGKSTFSINLAAALAQTQRTLLIDADMRRPAVSGVLRLPQGAKGLSNLVSGTGTPAECIHALQGSQLAIMPAGTIPPNPLELLLSQRFKNVLEQLSAQYDVVVIDSPPVELVSDALVLGGLATGVLYVVKAVATPYQLARKGLQRLRRSNARILGVVLNQLDFETAEKYYGEYSGYGRRYSHGKGGRNGYWQGYGQPQAQPQAQPHEPLMAAKAAVPVAS